MVCISDRPEPSSGVPNWPPTSLPTLTHTHIYTRTLSHTFACVVMAVDQCYLGGILHIPKRNIRQNCEEKTPPALSTDTYAKLLRLFWRPRLILLSFQTEAFPEASPMRDQVLFWKRVPTIHLKFCGHSQTITLLPLDCCTKLHTSEPPESRISGFFQKLC